MSKIENPESKNEPPPGDLPGTEDRPGAAIGRARRWHDADREVVVHRGAVALVPMVDDQHVCLVENHRYSVGKTLLEVPAGTIDEGESPEQTAERELREETGYRAGRIRRLRDWYVSPGVMTERMYLFLCEDLERRAAQLEPDERLKTVVVPWDEALCHGRRRPDRGCQVDPCSVIGSGDTVLSADSNWPTMSG